MFQSIEQIKSANRRNGGFWFSPDTLRFFNSRIGSAVRQLSEADGALFTTSETPDYSTPRLYTVRRAAADGTISTVGEFRSFTTSAKAQRAAAAVAADYRAHGTWDDDRAAAIVASLADVA